MNLPRHPVPVSAPLWLGLAVLLATTADLPAQTRLAAERVAQLVRHAGETFDAKGLSVSVVQDGDVLAEVAFGEARTGVPMTPTTLCNIASCTKAFTAAAVALLVERGEIGWSDPVVDHVPEFRLSDPWITANMTVRDLLCHRSGLVTFAGDLLWYDSDYDDAEVMRRMARLPIEQRFREQFGYQNLMYCVAGQVIERRTGRSWGDFVREELLDPLGMADTRTDAQRLPETAERALPHIDGEPIEDHVFVACKPAASMYSSVHELTAWMRMLLSGGQWQGQKLLDEASLRQMWRPHTNLATAGSGPAPDDFRSYGLGWFVSIDGGRKVVEHDGGMPGFLSKVSLIPAEGFGFAVLNNGSDGVLNEAVKRALLAERADGDGIAAIDRLAEIKQRIERRNERERAARVARRRDGTEPSHALEAYVGRYVDAIYGAATVSRRDDGGLHVVLEPAKRRLFGPLQHWHDDTFRVDFPDRFLPFALVRFELDAHSRITAMRIDCPIADFDFAALDFRRER